MTDDGVPVAPPVPHPTVISQPFWDGCRRHELLVQRCAACRTLSFPPQERCRDCFSPDLEWEQACGRGRILSYTEVHRPATPAFETPYVIAIVALEEGWELLTNIVDSPIETIEVGGLVEVVFVDVAGATLPKFRTPAIAP
jgi:hypothetical protein